MAGPQTKSVPFEAAESNFAGSRSFAASAEKPVTEIAAFRAKFKGPLEGPFFCSKKCMEINTNNADQEKVKRRNVVY
jgi:hypothetical protein